MSGGEGHGKERPWPMLDGTSASGEMRPPTLAGNLQHNMISKPASGLQTGRLGLSDLCFLENPRCAGRLALIYYGPGLRYLPCSRDSARWAEPAWPILTRAGRIITLHIDFHFWTALGWECPTGRVSF